MLDMVCCLQVKYNINKTPVNRGKPESASNIGTYCVSLAPLLILWAWQRT